MGDARLDRVIIHSGGISLVHWQGNSPSEALRHSTWFGSLCGSLRFLARFKKIIWRGLHRILPLKCIMANRHVGTSSECPICHQGPEDILHLAFQCPAAREIWTTLGIHEIIEEAMIVDRSGSAALEEFLCRNSSLLSGFNDIGLKEVVAITSWLSGGFVEDAHTMKMFLPYS
jgi:hypothetical protein